jgi:hypothetical protein
MGHTLRAVLPVAPLGTAGPWLSLRFFKLSLVRPTRFNPSHHHHHQHHLPFSPVREALQTRMQ